MKTSRASLLLLTGFLLGAAAPMSVQGQGGGRPSLDVRADTVEAALRTLLDVWYPRAIDSLHGGYLSYFTYDWEPEGAQEKMIVTQARHVWTTAEAAAFYEEEKERYLPMAAHGFAFLREAMWDPLHGGFYTLVTRAGEPTGEGANALKTAYGNAFGIYGLAAYAGASGDTAALGLAQEAFRWLEEHSHDPVYGGYFQFMEPDGTPLTEGYAGTPPKDQNSSIHLLEAFTELYDVWPDALVRERLEEMLHVVRDTLVSREGSLRLYFGRDWMPVSYRDSSADVRAAHYNLDHVSFGHDVETAFLLLEAAHALGIGEDTTLVVAKRMVDRALQTGWDGDVGGFYDEGYVFPDSTDVTIIKDTKNWWAQAEALNTLLLMARRFPDDPMDYGERFEEQWRYVDAYLLDPEHGGWYDSGLDQDPESRGRPKGHIWKGAYHTARSLMAAVRGLEEWERGGEGD